MKTSHNDPASLVSLDNAGLFRDGRWLVRGVSFDIGRGEIVSLIGPNGAGKSTSAKMAIGVYTPDEGTVWRSGRLKVGYVPQKLNIDHSLPLSVRRLMTVTSRLSPDAISSSLDAVGISHLENAAVQNLSGGEFQRALLARAIARKPDLLVLDEPVQGVDYAGEIALYELISKIRDQQGCGVLLISHDLHVVMAKTDTVVCLNGHVCCTGTPEAVSGSDAYQALFGTRGDGTLALYQHHHDHTHLPDGRVRHADGSVTQHCHPDDGHHDHDKAQDADQRERHHA